MRSLPSVSKLKWLRRTSATIIENAWKLYLTGTVKEAVAGVARDLWDWSHNILRDLEKIIKKMKKELEACQRGNPNDENVATEQILKYKLEKFEE